ncbi:MAG: M23 family metallopeptidase [Chloroflexota bacterium]|nr:M23 family metallopeptidase [Chloroflexota bacterium]
MAKTPVALARWRAWRSKAERWITGGRGGLISRYTGHLAVISLVTFALFINGIELPHITTEPTIPTPAPYLGERTTAPPADRSGLRVISKQVLVRAPVPHTSIPDRARREVITYTVQSGDTVLAIAAKFGLQGETVVWSNASLEDSPDFLMPGQILNILPVDGVYHTVQAKDTLESIAKKFKVDVQAIVECEYNYLTEPYELTVGQHLIIPGGEKPYVPRYISAWKGPVPDDVERGTGIFGWPASGYITQGYWSQHRAIDIGSPTGTPVYAADSGFVTFAGWTELGYGRLIVIDHRNSFITYYAHLDACYVEAGDSVGKGTLIGALGNTGRSTGPHLHFEVRHKGVQRNPFVYLPK